MLISIETFHPLGFTDDVYAVLSRPGNFYFGPWWFSTLHTIQTPMVGVVAAGLLLLLAGLSGLWAWVARGAALVWIVYYTVLDSIQGIFLGWLIAKSLDAPAETQRFVATLTQDMYTDRMIGGVSSVVSLTARGRSSWRPPPRRSPWPSEGDPVAAARSGAGWPDHPAQPRPPLWSGGLQPRIASGARARALAGTPACGASLIYARLQP